MLPTEQTRLYEIVTEALTLYDRAPTQDQLLAWWMACKAFAVHDVERAIMALQNDAEDGKRAPRPIDVVRKLRSGTTSASGCAAVDAQAGRCQYPGVWSDGTTGGGPWFCRWHIRDRNGPASARMIEMSQSVPYAETVQRLIDRRREEGDNPAIAALRAKLRKSGAPTDAHAMRMPGEDEQAA